MNALVLILATFAALAVSAVPAHADPLSDAIFLALASSGVAVGTATAIATFAVRTIATIALSALARALAPTPVKPGIKTSVTLGGTAPQTFLIGRYATAGHMICPPMSHGYSGKMPNGYLTYVVDLGDIPGQILESLIIDDGEVEIGTDAHPDYGMPLLGKYLNMGWVKYHDGHQTAADPMLLDRYAADPDRPWTADMVGAGVCYAILTFRFNRKVYSGLPRAIFVMSGIPLYDPRQDATVGGSGNQLWADPGTWKVADNPAVQIYNIHRGIALPGGSVWGGESAAADLPLDTWFAAMNACDVAVDLDAGGSEPQYRAGMEVSVDQKPADVIDELMKACSAETTGIGGVWKIRVGGPALPVYFLSDDDAIVTAAQSAEPFPGLDKTFNGIHATYPEPASLWQSKDAPPRYNADYEAADQDRRLVADLALPAVPYGTQVQRLMRAYIEEERRFRRHGLTLPPDAAILEPLDAVSWISARNGYDCKIFEVAECIDDLMKINQQITVRERDPGGL